MISNGVNYKTAIMTLALQFAANLKLCQIGSFVFWKLWALKRTLVGCHYGSVNSPQ
jgi:hypothetical protein